jgi:mannose-6-phosphate isomerase-like protein (cupin superfamily)
MKGALTAFGIVLVGLAGIGFTAAAPPAPARAPAKPAVPYVVKSGTALADLEKTLLGPGAHPGELVKPGKDVAVEAVWRHEEDWEQGELESHDGKDHIFFVTDGKATLKLGGELESPREISPGEWRAKQARNVQAVEVKKGDFIYIPHGTVHGRTVKGSKVTILLLSFWPGGAPAPATAVAAPAPAKK